VTANLEGTPPTSADAERKWLRRGYACGSRSGAQPRGRFSFAAVWAQRTGTRRATDAGAYRRRVLPPDILRRRRRGCDIQGDHNSAGGADDPEGVATGRSQSAFRSSLSVNAVHPLTTPVRRLSDPPKRRPANASGFTAARSGWRAMMRRTRSRPAATPAGRADIGRADHRYEDRMRHGGLRAQPHASAGIGAATTGAWRSPARRTRKRRGGSRPCRRRSTWVRRARIREQRAAFTRSSSGDRRALTRWVRDGVVHRRSRTRSSFEARRSGRAGSDVSSATAQRATPGAAPACRSGSDDGGDDLTAPPTRRSGDGAGRGAANFCFLFGRTRALRRAGR